MIEVPGEKVSHRIITPNCWNMHGPALFHEAVVPLKDDFWKTHREREGDRPNLRFHLVLTVEEVPEGGNAKDDERDGESYTFVSG